MRGKLRLIALGTIFALLGAFTLTSAIPTHAANTGKVNRGGSLNLSGTLPTSFIYDGGTGTISNLTVSGFKVVNGVLQAVGSASGTYTPAGGSATPFTSNFTAPLTSPGTCPVLSLSLGPINLDLLGLVVTTNQINLNITAVSGPGNLLGNLLCAVANLLNGSGGLNVLLGQISNLLNQLLGGGVLTL